VGPESVGEDGSNGRIASSNSAPGGNRLTTGGDGATGGTNSDPGAAATGDQSGQEGAGGGGGGGASGRIRINGLVGCTIDSASVISPDARGNGTGNCPNP
jgi:hypothetical protein